MSLFGSGGNSTNTAALQGYKAQTSVYGIGLQIVLGTVRVVGNIIWIGGWTANPVSSGGKLGGKGSTGGKGGGQYNYSCSFMIALCQGPVIAYGQVWSDRTQVVPEPANPSYPDAFIIGSRGQGVWGFLAGTYPNQALGYSETVLACYENRNLGTGGTISNYGFEIAGQAINITGIVNAAGGAPDAQVTITWVSGQNFTVAGYVAGQDIQVQGIGVTITEVVDSTHMTVTPPPLGTGGGSGVVIGWQDALVSDAINFLLTDFNCANFGFSPVTGMPLVYSMAGPGFVATSSTSITVGTGSKSFTTQAGLSYAGGMRARASSIGAPGTWVEGAVTSYSGTTLVINVDATNGSGTFADWQLSSNNSGGVANYCQANGLGISPVLDSQDTYSSYLTEWLLVANSEAFSSEGVIKFATYGDMAISGNGATFTPDLSPLYDLDNDDFLDQTVTYTVAAQQDRNNYMSVEWTNRGRQYNTETMNDEDAWAVGQYGLRIASPTTIHSVCLAHAAQQVLTVQLKRSVYMLRTAEFTLGWKYSALEPMDLVSLPEQFPSTDRVLARLLTATEDDHGNMSWTAEILPFPILNPTINPKQGTGGNVPGFNAKPGATNPPIFFEVTPDLSSINFAPALTLLIALSGGPNWGGCSVYVSKNGGTDYALADPTAPQQNAKSIMGFSTGAYPYGADPDTTNLLSVNVQESLGVIDSVDQSVADNFKSLILVDDELMAYEYATQTSSNVYDFESGGGAKYMRRGVFGTFDVPHASNAPFTLIADGNQYEYQLQPGDIGKTFWFKFPAFNQAGQQHENISSVTAYPFTVRGTQTRFPLPPQPVGAFNLNEDPSLLGLTPGMTLMQSSVQNSDPSVSVGIASAFIPPKNTATTAIRAPKITSTAVIGGGSIAAGTYLVALSGYDTNGIETNFALTTVVVASGSSKVVITPSWDPSNYGYRVYSGPNIDQLSFVSGNGGIGGAPATITLSSLAPFGPGDGYGPLDEVEDHLRMTAFQISHGGIFGDIATSYGSFTVTFSSANLTLNQLAGYRLKLYALAPGGLIDFIPLLEVGIVSNTAGPASVLTLDTDLSVFVTAGILSSSVPSGDVWVCRIMPQSITSNSFTDPNFVSSYAPSGLAVNQDKGNIIIAVGGTGAGQIYNKIASNTSTSITIEGMWAVTPDATTDFVILYPSPLGFKDTPSVVVNGSSDLTLALNTVVISGTPYTYPTLANVVTVPVPNQSGVSSLLVLQSADSLGNLSDFELSPMQETYIFGQSGTVAPPSPYYNVPIVNGVATPDASKGTNLLVLTQDTILGQPINYSTGAGILTNWSLISQEDPSAPAWAVGTTYAAGVFVHFAPGGSNVAQLYVSLAAANTGNSPDSSPTWWQQQGHSLSVTPSNGYFIQGTLNTSASPANTECVISFQTDATGNTRATSTPTIDWPIPA